MLYFWTEKREDRSWGSPASGTCDVCGKQESQKIQSSGIKFCVQTLHKSLPECQTANVQDKKEGVSKPANGKNFKT